MTRGRPPKPTAPLARDYLAGNSIQEVADKHKVTTALVQRALKTEDVELRPAHQADPDRDLAVIRLRNDFGLAWTEIAAVTGIPPSTLQRHYAKAIQAAESADVAIAAEFGGLTATAGRRLGHRAGLPHPNPSPRKELPLTDEELRNRHAAGETYKELAIVCGVSPALIWRRINFRRTLDR